MRIVFAPRESGRIEFGIIYGSIALLLLIAARFLPLLALAPDCTFRLLTGLPCPTCGSTRSLVHLAHGEFLCAVGMNPLAASAVLLAVGGLAFGLTAAILDLPQLSLSLSALEKRRVRFFCFLMLFANWAYLFGVL